jgi:uncharacterized protein (DUF983 family)
MSTPAFVMLIIGCIVVAIVIHEMRNEETSLLYELLFWLFVSWSVYFLLIRVLT